MNAFTWLKLKLQNEADNKGAINLIANEQAVPEFLFTFKTYIKEYVVTNWRNSLPSFKEKSLFFAQEDKQMKYNCLHCLFK